MKRNYVVSRVGRIAQEAGWKVSTFRGYALFPEKNEIEDCISITFCKARWTYTFDVAHDDLFSSFLERMERSAAPGSELSRLVNELALA